MQLIHESTFKISLIFTFIMLYSLDNISSALTNPPGSNSLSFILREFAHLPLWVIRLIEQFH